MYFFKSGSQKVYKNVDIDLSVNISVICDNSCIKQIKRTQTEVV